jgi:hypothetical protein
MELIILLIKLLIRGLDSSSSGSRSRNLPNFNSPATPPPLPSAPTGTAQMGNRPPTARPGKRKAPAGRLPDQTGQKPVVAPKATAVAPVARSAAPIAGVKSSAAPAQLIGEALRSPRNFAAAVLMTELLGPPASLRSRQTSLD